MKVKNKIRCIIIAFVAILCGSCTNTEADQKFDENPTQRLNNQKSELNDLLLSSTEGWKAVYYTDSTQLGGWTHLFKFLPNGKVDMVSDFDEDTAIYRSDYEIKLGSTTSLVFTTGSKIHLLSESDNYPTAALETKGYLGDFQFYYYGQENGDIIFKTNRNYQELRLVRATAKDWNDFSGNNLMIQKFRGLDSPLFKILEVNDGSTINKFEFDFNSDARFSNIIPLTQSSNAGFKMALSYTPTGFKAKPAILVKGQEISDFTYDGMSGNFIATGIAGASATVKFTKIPHYLSNDYKKLEKGQPEISLVYHNFELSKVPSTSVYFRSLVQKLNAKLPAGQSLDKIYIICNVATNKTSQIRYGFNGGKPMIFHFVNARPDHVKKTISFEGTFWFPIADPSLAILKDIDNELTNLKGLYIKKENFKVQHTNDIYTITSTENNFRMTSYLY